MSSLIQFTDVDKTFTNGTKALSGFSLSLREGEFSSILGPSGCGKSTALRIMAGLTEPSAGTLSRGPASSEISFVFQDATLMPWANVWDNVCLPLKIQGKPESELQARATEALELVGLRDFRAAYPRELSGGMKMRVSIARAIVTRPKLLLMDEPFAALDELTRSKLNNNLLALTHQYKLTVVFVTHSIYESVFLSDRIIVMSGRPGKVIGDVAVTVAGQRDEFYRTSAAYGVQCREVSALLGHAGGVDEH